MSNHSFEQKIVNELHQPNGMQHVFRDLQFLRQHESQKDFHKDLGHLNHTLHKQGLLPKFEVIDPSSSGFALREKGGHQQHPSTGSVGAEAGADAVHGGPHRSKHRRQSPDRLSPNSQRNTLEPDPSSAAASPEQTEAPPVMPAREGSRGRTSAARNSDLADRPDAPLRRGLKRPRQADAPDDDLPPADSQAEHKTGDRNRNGRVAFFGDSITKGMTASSEFKKNFGADVENFGHDSDTTQNLMSRLRSGQDDSKGGAPEKGVILIGTNNLGKGETDHQIAQDVLADVAEASRLNPGTKFLVVGLLPRGQSAQSPYRQHIANINRELEASLAGKSNVKFTDVGKSMLEADGNMSNRLWQSKYDYVHPTFNAGFDRLLDLIKPEVDSL
jgi:hypothetical protein